MSFSPAASWTRDTALNTYIFGLFLIGLPFTLFGNFVIYQLQVVGYMIGTDSEGNPCLDYCLVPFGSQMLDLNSVLLYLNALGFGLGGFCSLLISAYADFWKRKGVLVALFIVVYGAIAIPVYWLRATTLASFNSLMALYVLYAIVTYILSALFCMFIPHCMRVAGNQECSNSFSPPHLSDNDPKIPIPETTSYEIDTGATQVSMSRRYGFQMSIWGSFGTAVAGCIALAVVIILSQTLPGDAGQSAGLLVTTVAGFITIAGSVVTYFGLPIIPQKAKKDWRAWWITLLTPLKDLLLRKNMAILLLSYTIYTDTVFALNSVTSQLYFIEVKPDTLEFSLYSMAFSIFGAVTTVGFFLWQSWRPPFKLEYWLVIGYALVLIIPIWGCVGFADSDDFGFKNRWEFYVQSLLFNTSGSIVNSVFRVLFSELVPKGSEIEWFGLQVVLSCATAWVSYVANAPLQNATHQLRFPLVLCLIILVVPVGLEVMRCGLNYFARDRIHWQEYDTSEAGTFDNGT